MTASKRAGHRTWWRNRYLQSPAEGLWREGGETDTDHIVIFEVMTEEVDLPRWRKRRAELERRFRQDNVVIRYVPLALV